MENSMKKNKNSFNSSNNYKPAGTLKKGLAVILGHAMLAAAVLLPLNTMTAEAAPAYDSKWTQPITIEQLMGEGLQKNTDAKGVYEELRQGFRFKTITQGSLYSMYLNGGKIPVEALQLLYNDGYISGFLFKYMAGLPFTPADLKDVFNAPVYYAAYPSVAASIPYDENLLLVDFMLNGMPEGRIGSFEFNPAIYMSNYPEVAAILGNNWMNYYIHYMLIGKEQGMTGSALIR